MHRALFLDEVVLSIVACLGPGPWAEGGTLLALATVNRMMSEIALDRLWASPEILDLAERMDPSTWTVYHIDEDTSIMVSDYRWFTPSPIPKVNRLMQELVEGTNVSSTICPGDRFLFYARRVQVLRLDNNRDKRVSASTIAWWADLHSQSNIFPKLRRVEVRPHDEHSMDAQTILSFVTPSLVHLDLDLYPTTGMVVNEHAQACVPAHLPCLRSLKFWEDTASILPVGPLLVALVDSARNLREIQVAGQISVNHISAITKLENICKLDIRSWSKEIYPSFQPLADVFQQLRHWEIHEDNHMCCWTSSDQSHPTLDWSSLPTRVMSRT
jgi:hypothetical protein